MRIPAEVLPLVAKLGKEADDVSKAEPVSGVAGIGTGLSAALPDRPSATTRRQRPQRADPQTEATQTEQTENPPPAVERRQQERRTEKRPILLDTRSKRGRRKAGGDVKINIKV